MAGERREVLDWATDWDSIGPQYHEHDRAVWEELRGRCPVAHTERFGGAWFPVRYDDIVAVAHDTATYSSAGVVLADPPGPFFEMPPLTMDPPAHLAYRRVLLPRFTPQQVERHRPAAVAICNDLIDSFLAAGRVEAATDYAQAVPVQVIGHLLGIPRPDRDQIRHWIHDITELGRADPEAASRATREVLAYLRAQLDDRRNHGGDDLIAWVVAAQLDRAPIPARTQASMLLVALTGGIDDTWSALGAAIAHLATHPTDQQRLRLEPDLLPTAVEELLRFYAPVDVGRLVVRDAELGGCPIKAGDRLLLSFPDANADPAVFPDADRVVLDRAHNPHLTFGIGVHRCLSSNLARMMLRVGLSTLLERVPPFWLAPGATIIRTTGGNTHGPRGIPLVFDAVQTG
ncbi:MAG: cytochrome P450 [Vicinamibacterales bacterium]